MEIWIWIIGAFVLLLLIPPVVAGLRGHQKRLNAALEYLKWHHEIMDRHLAKIASELDRGVPINPEQLDDLYMNFMEYRRITRLTAEQEGDARHPDMEDMLSKIGQQEERYRMLIDVDYRILERLGFPDIPYRDLSVPFTPYRGPGAIPFDFGDSSR